MALNACIRKNAKNFSCYRKIRKISVNKWEEKTTNKERGK